MHAPHGFLAASAGTDIASSELETELRNMRWSTTIGATSSHEPFGRRDQSIEPTLVGENPDPAHRGCLIRNAGIVMRAIRARR
jgi:hypothetical protein